MKKTIYQVATLASLQMGGFDGVIPVGELRTHGDIGIGTFHAVDGEMILLDGIVYQALEDGTIQVADDAVTVPFATVTQFAPEETLTLANVGSMADFAQKMDAAIQRRGANNPYAVRVDGVFDHLHVRSVKPQSKPYRMLSEAMKTSQLDYTFDHTEGTIVGIWFPEYFGQVNLAGWHFHYITADRKRGGHVLAMNFSTASASLSAAEGFELMLPQTELFQRLNLTSEHVADVKEIESSEQAN